MAIHQLNTRIFSFNRRFLYLNAVNTPLKKCKYASVIGPLNAFSNLLNLFPPDSTPLELVTDFGAFNPFNWNIATKLFQQPFPNSANAHLCVLRYHDKPDHKILHNFVKHSFVLHFCQNSKQYQCRNLLHRILHCTQIQLILCVLCCE